jgi:hypothetical protein
VADQFLRPLGLRPRSEIRRSPDDCAAHVRPDAHRDHVLRHLLAAAHAGVETLCDDIGQAIVDDDLEFDVRILPRQLREFRPEDCVGRVVCGGDPNGAGGLLPKFAQSLEPGLDLLEPRADGVEQAFARLRRRDAARGAGQQPKAEPFLEATNGVAERRLRHAELRCGLRKTALLPDGQEGQQVIQLSAVHLWHQLISPFELYGIIAPDARV